MKPYIFGHRGASGYEVENTITAFEKAVIMGVGIETDVQLTKDNKLVCFHYVLLCYFFLFLSSLVGYYFLK